MHKRVFFLSYPNYDHYKLNSHLHKHSKGKPFICDVCYNSFCLKETLYQHMRSFTREKQFSCDECSK